MFFRYMLPGHYRLTFTFTKTTDTQGVKSRIGEDAHILMWDFDGSERLVVLSALKHVQRMYELPDIHVMESRPGGGSLHAYCFKRLPWQKTCEIIAATEGVDMGYFRWGVIRKEWTLRITEKDGHVPTPLTVLTSHYPPDATHRDLQRFVSYETLPRGR